MNRKTYLAPDFRKIYLVGVGGTGGYIAEGLAKMLSGYKLDIEVVLIDPDVIEEKNCARQNFHHYEIGLPKALALATRLNQRHGLKFGYSQMRGEEFLSTTSCYSTNLLISCVDTVSARKAIKGERPWLDLGNGEHTGQAIFGTSDNPDQIENWDLTPNCGQLPSPFVVGKIGTLEDEPRVPSCADQPFNEQGVFVNEWAAQAGLTILFQLLIAKEVSTPHIYFDALRGRMNPVYITKELFKC